MEYGMPLTTHFHKQKKQLIIRGIERNVSDQTLCLPQSTYRWAFVNGTDTP
mgnify:CR=1 FL=1